MSQLWGFGKVMAIVAQTGEWQQLEQIANLALTAAQSIPDEDPKRWNVHLVLPILLQEHMWTHSLAAVLLIPKNNGRGEALRDLAKELVETNETSSTVSNLLFKIYNEAQKLEESHYRESTVNYVLYALAQLGHFQEVLAIVQNLDKYESQLDALESVSAALASKLEESEAWTELTLTLNTAQMLRQDGMSCVIYYLVPWLAKLDQGQTLQQIYKSIQEIDSWWQ